MNGNQLIIALFLKIVKQKLQALTFKNTPTFQWEVSINVKKNNQDIYLNKRQRKPKGKPRMDKLEKLARLGTQDEDIQNKIKHNTEN